ncbi:MAG TPA: hypothetical protein VG477_19445 [Thermoanaerobaculia bacterium]|nr:hypothetical protein [Thermoanaerobaculia bacterium]
MKLLSRDDILRALQALASELSPEASPTEIIVGGGAALVLLYEARAARRVAQTLGLPEDWLNDGAKGYLHGLLPGDVLFQKTPLTVRSVAPRQLLAMKLSAWRDDIDIADARLLLSKLAGSSDEVWKQVEPYLVPGRELKTRYAFEDLWELERGHS